MEGIGCNYIILTRYKNLELRLNAGNEYAKKVLAAGDDLKERERILDEAFAKGYVMTGVMVPTR